MQIEIYADVVCPWCWIGERRLLQALLDVSPEVQVRWRAFQLDPGFTAAGTPLVDWLARKYGGVDVARRMFTNVSSVARDDGLELNFDRAIAANSFDAHRLIWGAASVGKQREVAEALHKAHFTDGLDIGSRPVLAKISNIWGVPVQLDSDEGVAEVDEELRVGRELGVTGVPMFVFNGKWALSGAQDPATFRAAVDRASQLR